MKMKLRNDSAADLEFVVNAIESNYPGYEINLSWKERNVYENHKKNIYEKISKDNITRKDTVLIINKYLNFFYDKHLRLYDPQQVDEQKYIRDLFQNKLPKVELIDFNHCYITIPSFNFRLYRKLDSFYRILKKIIVNKNIIIDVRDNSGGGERMYLRLVKIVKSLPATSKIYIIQNRNSASATEDFILALAPLSNVKTVGTRSSGQLAYGAIRKIVTPHFKLNLIIPTEFYSSKLKYEYMGVKPEILTKSIDDKEKLISELFNISAS